MKTKLQKLLDKTERTQYIDRDVLKSAPEYKGKKTNLEFFTLGKYVNNEELEKEYESRGLVPADVSSIVEFDLKNGREMDTKRYVATHWKDGQGRWCFIAFSRWFGGRRDVRVRRDDDAWDDDWWFAGLRKSDLGTLETRPLYDYRYNLDTFDLGPSSLVPSPKLVNIEDEFEKLNKKLDKILKKLK